MKMKKDQYKALQKFDYTRLFDKKTEAGTCLIIGSFGASNLGDEAILAGQISELRKAGIKRITVAGETPELISNYHRVKSIKVKNLPKIIKAIYNSDVIIIGGGGIFCKNVGGYKGFLYQLYILSLICFGYLLGKNISAIGIGFYKNQNKLVRLLAYKLLRHINLVTVRDFQSFEELQSLKVNAEIYKDTSFFMKLKTKNQLMENAFIEGNYKKGQNIGLSLVNHRVNEKYKPRVIREMKKFIEKHPNATYWYYTLDSGYGSKGDYLIGKELEAKVNNQRSKKIRFVFVPSTFNPEIVFSSFRLMNFLITTRFHASVFAYRSGVNFVGISYDEKCSTFLDSIGKDYRSLKGVSFGFINKGYNKIH